MARNAKKRHQKKSKAIESLMADVQKSDKFKNYEIVDPVEGMVKMSDAIDELLKPYEHQAETMEAYEKLLAVGCMAWNAANMSESKQDAAVHEFLRGLPGISEKSEVDMIVFMKSLVERKVLLYPNDKRMVIKYKVTENKNDFDLTIAYTTSREDYEENKNG